MVQGRHGKKWMTALLLAALLLLLTPAAQAEEMPSFRFSLSANGKTEVQAQPGDVIALLLRLERTDSDDPYTMYAMQDEVVYDPLFLQLLPENSLTAEGVRIADAAEAGGVRACYLAFADFNGGAAWQWCSFRWWGRAARPCCTIGITWCRGRTGEARMTRRPAM